MRRYRNILSVHFTHNISNCINKQFNNANKILEADTKELRISIIHESAAISGISICIRKSPCFVRNTLENLLDQKYCEKEVLHLLLNCVQAKMNLVLEGSRGRQDRMCKIFYAVYQKGRACYHDRRFVGDPLCEHQSRCRCG